MRKDLIEQLLDNGKGQQVDTFEEIVGQYPLKIVYDSSKGLGLVARRDILQGETVLRECPLSMALETEFLDCYCSTCSGLLPEEDKLDWSNRKLLLSPLCQDCSYNNHLLDEHKRFSEIDLQSQSVDDTGLYAILLRFFGQYSVGRHAAADDDVVCADFETASLLTTDEGPFDDEELCQDIKNVAQYIRTYQSPAGKQLKQSEIHQLCRIIVCNQHSVSGSSANVGRAFYPIAAMLNHSCQPNVQWTSSFETRSYIECIARQDIKINEELTISYLPLDVLKGSFINRQKVIKQQRQFDCRCNLCEKQVRID